MNQIQPLRLYMTISHMLVLGIEAEKVIPSTGEMRDERRFSEGRPEKLKS